jgi:uncharacterized protein (TIGR02996 family)
MRDDELEAAVVASPADPEPCRVYADWLEERGRGIHASGYRVLGGICDERPERLEREIALVAVSISVWLQACVLGASVEEGSGFDGGAFELIEEQRSTLDRRRAAVDAWSPSDRDALVEDVRAARALAPPEMFHRLMRRVMDNVVATERLPLEADSALADELAVDSGEAFALDLPLEAELGSFDFENVMISNSTVGVKGLHWVRRADTPPPAQAFCAMTAAQEFTEPEGYNEMTREERHEWLIEDYLFGDPFEWAPMSHFDFLSWAFDYLVENRGAGPVVGDQEQSLLDVIDAFGVFRCGIYTDGCQFPLHFFVFDRAYVVSQLLC